VEVTSGRHEPSPFTRLWSGRPWQLPHADKASQTARKSSSERCSRAKALSHSAQEEEATEVSEAWSSAGAVGLKRPRSRSHAPDTGRCWREARTGSACLATIRRSVHECREALGPSVSRTKPKTSWDVHAVKAAERAGNARSTGARISFRWQKSVRRIARLVHRESARPRGGKNRALARRKLEAPPDAGHEPRDGETVCE
jgi:hypothetical protein